MAKAKKSSDGSKVSKSAFVRQHPGLSPAEVEAKAKEAGMTLSAAYVSNIRSADKAKGGAKKTRGPKKGAAKAEAASTPKRKTGPTPGGGPSKSDFIRENPSLSVKDLIAAGAAKGIELSAGLIYGVRAAKGAKGANAKGATGAKRGRRPGSTTAASVASGGSATSSRGAAGDPVKEILRIAIASAGIDGAARLISDAHKRISMIA